MSTAKGACVGHGPAIVRLAQPGNCEMSTARRLCDEHGQAGVRWARPGDLCNGRNQVDTVTAARPAC
eukprot:362761-Chlamydomonas_euryale.AAC.3